MKERQVFNFSERELRSRGIQVKDNLGIETSDGLVDIQVDIPLLEADILAIVECQSPQFFKKAVDIIDRLNFYFGKRPYIEVALEEVATRGEATKESLRDLRRKLQVTKLVNLGSTALSRFNANQKIPFFYFNTSALVKEFGPKRFLKRFKNCWVHERQHFVDFLDPVRYEQMLKDIKEIVDLFGTIEGGVGAVSTIGGAYVLIKEAQRRKVSRRGFLKAGLTGIAIGGAATLAFSPFSAMFSRLFTYWTGFEAEERARQAEKEGRLIRPFEEIFQIRFYSEP